MAGKKRKKPDAPPEVQQKAEKVGGPVYQAGRDVHITAPAGDDKKDPVKRIHLWLGIVVAIIVIVTGVFDIFGIFPDRTQPESARYYGLLLDEDGQPVANATISIRSEQESGQLLGKGETKRNGEFSVAVKAKPESTAWVVITKDGMVGFEGMQVLAGSNRPSFRRQP
jgi:hypothetical protein